jgi:hypothetical protein
MERQLQDQEEVSTFLSNDDVERQLQEQEEVRIK